MSGVGGRRSVAGVGRKGTGEDRGRSSQETGPEVRDERQGTEPRTENVPGRSAPTDPSPTETRARTTDDHASVVLRDRRVQGVGSEEKDWYWFS